MPADLPAQRLHQTAECAGQRRFADAVAAHQADDFPRPEREVRQRAQRVLLVVAQRDIFQRQHRRAQAFSALFRGDFCPAVVQRPPAQAVFGQAFGGQGGKLRRRPLGRQRTVRKVKIAIHQVGDPGQAVLGQHDGDAALFHRGNHVVHTCDGSGIQIARRLVQNQQFGAEHTGRCKRDLLLLSARELEHTAAHQRLNVELPGCLGHPGADGFRRQTAVFAGEGQLGGGVHVEILCLRVLEHAAHLGHVVLDGGLARGQARRRTLPSQRTGVEHWGQAIEQP